MTIDRQKPVQEIMKYMYYILLNPFALQYIWDNWDAGRCEEKRGLKGTAPRDFRLQFST